MTPTAAPTGLVVMGVSGCGKSTVARLAAERLGWEMDEADDFHPPQNVARMARGVPLTDHDRLPWLTALRDRMSARAAAGHSTVLACSALKRSYRDLLRGARCRVRFVFLDGTPQAVAERLAGRSGHFMPASLLESQFADLEPLAGDEDGVTVALAGAPEEITGEALGRLGLLAPPPA